MQELDWPWKRLPTFGGIGGAVGECWQRTSASLCTIAERLRSGLNSHKVSCVAVSGSMGRMEQTEHSDADVLVVVDPPCAGDEQRSGYEHVWSCLQELGHAPPDPNGIYSVPMRSDAAFDPSLLGKIDESPETFGQRIQLLLDSQPVWGIANFESCQRSAVTWYAGGAIDPAGVFEYLLNDSTRYFRSLWAMYTRKWPLQSQEWKLFQIKLWHSRLLSHAGLVSLIGDAQTSGDPVSHLLSGLRLTPLERMMSAGSADAILACYDKYLGVMSKLQQGDLSIYTALEENGRNLRRLVSRWLIDHASDWGDDFLARLLL